MDIDTLIEVYGWDKEFDYEVLSKLRENLHSLIDYESTKMNKGKPRCFFKSCIETVHDEPEFLLEYIGMMELDIFTSPPHCYVCKKCVLKLMEDETIHKIELRRMSVYDN